jgi:hypothetical protein
MYFSLVNIFMLDNFFVYETPDFLDLPYIQNLVMKKLEEEFVLKGYVRIDINDDPYLKSIQEKFPFLGSWLNIYHTPPNGYIPFHIDGHRKAAFNIPIQDCNETSQTIWYEPLPGTEFSIWYKEDERHYRVEGERVEAYRFALVRPTLIRNDVAHDVKRFNATGTRIIASWGCAGTFEECKDAFKLVLEKS